jgi:hypothetical protein
MATTDELRDRDSLARSLVDAAAEAIDEAVRSKWHGDNLDFLSSPDDWARAAALAVLEKLASAGAAIEDYGADVPEMCRALVAQIREGR